MTAKRRLTAVRERLSSNAHVRMLVIDSLIGIACILLFIILFGSTSTGMPGLLFQYDELGQILWAIIITSPVFIRRTRPQTAALLFAGLTVLQLAVGPALIFSDMFALLMLYSVLVYGDPRNTKAFVVLASAIGILSGATMSWALNVGPYVTPFLTAHEYATLIDDPNAVPACQLVYAAGQFTGACAQLVMQETAIYVVGILTCIISVTIAAFWQRARLITVRMMRERNEALAASEAEERRIAALAERARIARDMHDVVAHTLSIIIVQSDGGRYAGTHDPAVARQTMETIRHESERALHDMKRLFGVFGGSDHADYTDIDALVDQARAIAASQHGAIERHINGIARPQLLEHTASVALYHLVQEALTNVRKYAGPNVHVDIAEQWSDHALDITVSDDGRGASSSLDGHKPGYGLLGMRERIDAVGGTVTAGPQVGGGFAVQAIVPLSERSTDSIIDSDVAQPLASAATRSASRSTSQVANETAHAIDDADSVRTATGPTVRHADATHSTGAQPAVTDISRQSMPSRFSQPTGNSSAQLPQLPQLPTWSTIRERLQSKPIAQYVNANGEPFNWVERLSRWTQRHYLATDVIVTLLLILLMYDSQIALFGEYIDDSSSQIAVSRLIEVATMLPLCVRRRFPETAAAMVAIVSVLQLLMLQPVTIANLLALCALYSAVLYGREHAWRWTAMVSAGIAVLFGFKAMLNNIGYASVLHWMMRVTDYAVTPAESMPRMMLDMAIWTGFVGATCTGTILLALWQRSSGSNALVLQAREDALRAEQAKQKVLAANMERDRISARIQTEVSRTLMSVIDQAAAGVRMLDDAGKRGEEPSADSISSAFAAIGKQGRAALAHMRQLLSVLRETGFSDEAHEHAQPDMQLRPAASLDEQLDEARRA